ncbi:FAD/NAD(P)-binding domain-containing protein [Exidia glandulosa HHB12029]|uniref:FAD/NAD(P)-binding domain-containing protein n=1 Tax=Exidia glandulosa HHB12029 TaxID=1314781 RepID=A0A165EIG5_EXIGL|nr:FAD/NAD(P)-binding domain-containing protein [Exidia glandulosa HHB12029]
MPLALHRNALVTALKNRIQPDVSPFCTVHVSSRMTSYAESSDGLTLTFSNGNTAPADVLIGADGVRSIVRAGMFSNSPATWTGTIAYRALITTESLERVHGGAHPATSKFVVYCGTGKHIVAYPISRGSLINIVAFVTVDEWGAVYTYQGDADSRKWVHDDTTEHVLAEYEGWEPDVINLLKTAEKYSAWAIHAVEDVSSCAVGRAAILGDALHAMETHLGAGAGQAMEDAYVLGRLLTHPSINRSNVQAALKAYERTRLAPAQHVAHCARRAGRAYEFAVEKKPAGKAEMRATADGRTIKEPGDDWTTAWGRFVVEQWQIQWDGCPDDWWETAQAELKCVLEEEKDASVVP